MTSLCIDIFLPLIADQKLEKVPYIVLSHKHTLLMLPLLLEVKSFISKNLEEVSMLVGHYIKIHEERHIQTSIRVQRKQVIQKSHLKILLVKYIFSFNTLNKMWDEVGGCTRTRPSTFSLQKLSFMVELEPTWYTEACFIPLKLFPTSLFLCHDLELRCWLLYVFFSFNSTSFIEFNQQSNAREKSDYIFACEH